MVMTIVALAAGLFASKRRNDKLQAQNQTLVADNTQYRNELGLFEIEDPAKIHVIRLASEDDQPRKYRVYLPPGRKYVRCYRSNAIPEIGIPKGVADDTLEPGNYLFSIGVTRRKGDGDSDAVATFTLNTERTDEEHWRRSMTRVHLSEKENDWIINNDTGEMACRVSEPGRELELHDPEQPLVLYRARAEKIVVKDRSDTGNAMTWSTESIDGPCDGFMVWIKPEKPEQ